MMNLRAIFLDFLEMTVYTSNNLRQVSNCSTLWKRRCMLMICMHWDQLMEIMKRRRCRLLYPIEGPGVVIPESDSSSSR